MFFDGYFSPNWLYYDNPFDYLDRDVKKIEKKESDHADDSIKKCPKCGCTNISVSHTVDWDNGKKEEHCCCKCHSCGNTVESKDGTIKSAVKEWNENAEKLSNQLPVLYREALAKICCDKLKNIYRKDDDENAKQINEWNILDTISELSSMGLLNVNECKKLIDG